MKPFVSGLVANVEVVNLNIILKNTVIHQCQTMVNK